MVGQWIVRSCTVCPVGAIGDCGGKGFGLMSQMQQGDAAGAWCQAIGLLRLAAIIGGVAGDRRFRAVVKWSWLGYLRFGASRGLDLSSGVRRAGRCCVRLLVSQMYLKCVSVLGAW